MNNVKNIGEKAILEGTLSTITLVRIDNDHFKTISAPYASLGPDILTNEEAQVLIDRLTNEGWDFYIR